MKRTEGVKQDPSALLLLPFREELVAAPPPPGWGRSPAALHEGVSVMIIANDHFILVVSILALFLKDLNVISGADLQPIKNPQVRRTKLREL